VRAQSPSSEEALRARNLLKDWLGEGFLTPAQYRLMEQETACDLRRTNIFLRLVLFLFSLIIVGAGMGLFFVVFLSHPSEQTTGVFLLFFAAISYAAAEIAVSQARLYRYGIEEALVVCSVGFLCVGMELAFFVGGSTSAQHSMEFLVPVAGIIASILIWRRFGLHYAFLGAMIFVPWLAYDWTSSHVAQHLIVVALYAVGLIAVAALRSGDRLTYLDIEYSAAEALLCFGIYMAINLQLSSVDLLGEWWHGLRNSSAFPKTFYWTTWVLIWCLPPAILARGVRRKDRFVIAAGAIAALLTLATNKPYLGWPRHTWDPMFLGVFLTGLALLLRRWLSRGPDGIRRGFTARRLSGKDKQWMKIASTAIGVAHSPATTPVPTSPDFHFGGGDSGGGGASSDF
jgi:uncharacterized membrane protein YgcG